MWLRIAIETSKRTIRSYRPWISGEGRQVDVFHQLVSHQALVVDVHAQVVRDVLAARVVQGPAVRAGCPRAP
jgi:hypothetical protein